LADRIVLIHALADSVEPIHAAFARQWPEASYVDLLDTSLASDLAAAGELTAAMRRRFLTLGTYALEQAGIVPADVVKAGSEKAAVEIHTAAILFTCSAFGPAIDDVKAALPIPVLKPNESAFAAALQHGRRIGLLVTFHPSLAALRNELQDMADQAGRQVDITAGFVDGALAALKAGDAARHDRLIAEATAAMPPLDVLVLGQFSMARAAATVATATTAPVLTTPDAAVLDLRRILASRSAPYQDR
jgi:Asp/Glu/hydantoin racemase